MSINMYYLKFRFRNLNVLIKRLLNLNYSFCILFQNHIRRKITFILFDVCSAL